MNNFPLLNIIISKTSQNFTSVTNLTNLSDKKQYFSIIVIKAHFKTIAIKKSPLTCVLLFYFNLHFGVAQCG
jgi:hypothetical protein